MQTVNFVLLALALAFSTANAAVSVLEFGQYSNSACTTVVGGALLYNTDNQCGTGTGGLLSHRATCGGLTLFATNDCSGTSSFAAAGACTASGDGSTFVKVGCVSGNYYVMTTTGATGSCTADGKLPSGTVTRTQPASPDRAGLNCLASGGLLDANAFSASLDSFTATTVSATFSTGLACAAPRANATTVEVGKCFLNPVNQFPTIISQAGAGAIVNVAGAAMFAVFAAISFVAL